MRGPLLLTGLLGVATAAAVQQAQHHYEFHLETRLHCIESLRDSHGKPPACSKSVAMETAGLTLPGMEDGTLTTRSHVIIASDGSEVRVEAHPSYPYQYFMRTADHESVRVERLINGEAVFIGSRASSADTKPMPLCSSRTLEADGWAFRGISEKDGMEVNEWFKQSFDGVDQSTGANYSAIYMANLGPDSWTLYMDKENQKPIRIVATNGRHGHVVHQEMRILSFEKRDHHLAVEDARQRMYELYQVSPPGGALFSATEADDDHDNEATEDDSSFSNLRASLLSGYIPPYSSEVPEATPWLARRGLRPSEVIPFFTVEEGTAAHEYFQKLNAPRRLMTLFEFQYPTTCKNSTNKDELCLFVSADGSGFQASFSLSVGIRLPDVNKPGRVAELALAVSLSLAPDNKNLVLDLSVKASGCAVVWELGEGISISITVCLTAKGGVHYSNSTLSFAASVGASISFDVNLPVVGSIIDFTINGELGCTAAPNNTVTAYGKIGVSHSVLVAGASITFDIVAATADHLPNKWQFSSGVTFSAWISLIFWRPHWNHCYLLWSVGPVTF